MQFSVNTVRMAGRWQSKQAVHDVPADLRREKFEGFACLRPEDLKVCDMRCYAM